MIELEAKQPLTYRHGRLLGVSCDHLYGDAGAEERSDRLLDSFPGGIDDADQTQEGQVPHLRPRSERQH